MKSLILSLFGILNTWTLSAQPCADPQLLCAETEANPVVFDQAAGVTVDCLDVLYVSYFEFTTNELLNPGSVIVSISSIDCHDSLVHEVFAMVVEAPTGDCDQAGYVPMGGCGSGTTEFSFESSDLSTDSRYILIIGTNLDPFANPCTAEVTISGSAVDIDACCDGEIPLGDPYEMSVIGGSEFFGLPPDYTWSPPETLSNSAVADPTAYPEETTTYEATGMVGDCEVTDFVTVFVGPPLSIPNTITPNGDLINDLWLIGGIQRFDGVLVTIYDRWGQMLYKSLGYTQPWDGTHNGKRLPTATYYYVFELNSLEVDIPPICGSVTLIH